jgi:hypothetical protein
MKNFFLWAILFFVSTVFVRAQNKSDDKQQAVQKAVIDLFQGLADRNLDKLKQNCTTDVLILEHGAVWNLDTLIQKVSQNTAPDFKRINTFEFIETKVSGQMAWTTYNNQAEVTRNGKTGVIKWIETAILTKEDGKWKIKTLHSTLLKRS